MSDEVAIRVENLSKKYVISHQRAKGDGLRHALQDTLTAPFRALKRSLSGKSKVEADSSRLNLNFPPSTDGTAVPPSASDLNLNSDPNLNLNSPASREDFWALKDVSFEVKRGEVLGIIGRNGAGKSTLLKILSRITEPTAGRITIEGRVASLLEVGTGFHPELTGRENIFLNGAILGMSRTEIRRKFDEIVAFAEIERFLDTPVKRYSSGMYVRLAFAVSAHLQTDILIIDEVLAVGDGEFQKKCLGKMEDIASRQGRTVLFVSHQLATIRRLCTIGCVLRDGRTNGIEAIENAISFYTQGLAGSPFDIHLEGVRRSEGRGETARILRVCIPSDSSLRYGEPLTILLSVECRQTIRNAIVGVGFDTFDGYRTLTLDCDNSAPPITLDPGLHEIRLSIERNPLHPGMYACGVGLMVGREVIDALPGCALWEVEASLHTVYRDRGFAGCRIPVSVSVSPGSVHKAGLPAL